MRLKPMPRFALVFSMVASQFGTPQVAPAQTTTLRYEIDRSEVPPLYHNDLTLKVRVGEADEVEVLADGTAIPHVLDPTTDQVRFTTSATDVSVVLNGASDSAELGQVTKSVLRDDKAFAWSLGMDDNVDLKATVAVMERYGWAGTFFLIANIVRDDRDEDWIVDTPYLQEKLAAGWALGNHTWSHACDSNIDEQQIIQGYERLQEIANASTVPDYKVTSFAAPCFVSQYHPVIINHRDTQRWTVQFNESGGRTTLVVDPGATEDLPPRPGLFRPGAEAFDYDLPVGRDTYLSVRDEQGLIDHLDWIALRHAEHGDHVWHNTLIHGGKEDAINTVAGHLATNYGPDKAVQVWVAPSDQIYSYLLVRDRSVVRPLPPPNVDYPAWVAAHFEPAQQDPSISGPAADANGDGLANLIDFAFGQHPFALMQENVPSMERLDFTYRRRRGGVRISPDQYRVENLVYEVETSTTMAAGSWQRSAIGLEEQVAVIDAEMEKVSLTPADPLAGASRLYYRVRVTLE